MYTKVYLTIIALSSILAGCAAPGFSSVESPFIDSLTVKKTYVLGYKPVLDNASDSPDDSHGALQNITPELVAKQWNARQTALPEPQKRLLGIAPIYTIGPGDVVGIIVYDHPELLPNAGAVISQSSDPTGVSVAPGFIVGANGEISFPYIGRLRISGLTEIEASDLIAKRIAKYIKDPQVSVRIASFRSRRVYVEGEVRLPGIQIVTDVPMTLAEAISRAGGITVNGDRSSITLTRGDTSYPIDLQFMQDVGVTPTQIPMLNGDVLTIRNREERKVYVMGEIIKPSAVLFRNGKLSLNEALGEAGGPNLLTANTGQIYVIRNTTYGTSDVYHLNAKNPTALALADKFTLLPRDVIYIDPVSLVRWNRIISLILPAAQVIDLGSQATTR